MTSLYFELDRRDGCLEYRPGEIVSGVVHLDLSPDTAHAAKGIEVAFSGRTEIECMTLNDRYPFGGAVEKRLPWHGNGRTILFDDIQTICMYDQAHLPSLGATQWPFSFVFPYDSSFNPNPRMRRWRTSAALTTTHAEPGLPLPPSFDVTRDDWNASLVYGSISGRASIIYEVEARLVSRQGTYLKHAFYTLQFVPYSQIPSLDPDFFTEQHSFRSESRQLFSKGKKTSLLSSAKSLLSKAPVSAFKLIIELPSHATMGEVLPLYLGIDYDLVNSTALDLPPVFLREVRIGWLEQIQLGSRLRVYSTEPTNTIQSLPLRRYMNFTFEKGKMMQVTERMALHQKITSDSFVVKNFSFEAPDIRRFYHDFYVVVTVVCNDKEFTASAGSKSRELVFLPPSLPPKGIELPDSRLLPPEAQSQAVYEMGNKAATNELHGEPLYELPGHV